MSAGPSFIFGGSTGETAASVKKKRAVAEALFRQTLNDTPHDLGSGLASLGKAIAYRFATNEADKAEEDRSGRASRIMGALQQGMAGPDLGPSALSYDPAGTAASGSSAKLKASAFDSDNGLPDYANAFLDTIAGPESGGAYNVKYGGGTFDDFADHPRQAMAITSGPNQGKTSSAAGRYQFLGSTWDDQRGKLGLHDFSPANQDLAAYALASDTFKAKTGQDLDAVLQSGDPDAIAGVGKSLSGVWTSLPGGIEQGTNTPRFMSAYQSALKRTNGAGRAIEAAAPVETASTDPNFLPGAREAIMSQPRQPQPTTGAEIDPREVPGLIAKRDPQAVPYSGPGATIDPAEIPALMNRTPEQQQAGYNRAMTGALDAARAQPPQPQRDRNFDLEDTVNASRGADTGGGVGRNQRIAAALGIGGEPKQPQFSPAVMAALNGDPGFDGFAQSMGGTSQAAPAGASYGDPRTPPPVPGGREGPNLTVLAQMAMDPSLDDDQRAYVSDMLTRQFKRQDLAEERTYEAQAATAKRRQDLADYRTKAGIDAEFASRKPGYTMISPQQAAAMGLPPGAYQMSPSGQVDAIGNGKGQNITVNTGSDSGKFYEEADKARGKSFNDMADAGATAQRSLIQIDELDKRLANVGTGGLAAMKQLAGSYGLPVGDLSESQAATALIDAMIPAQRPPGSGSMSDGDVAMFRRSLPSIINQPGGNALIIRTLRGIAQYDAQRGEIANQVLDREIKPSEGRRMMSALPNPLAEFRQNGGQGGAPDAGTPAPRGGPQVGMIEDGYRFKGGNPADASSWERVN